ncbi:MAG: Sjogren's syndrome/scleroderma autoantigen 1 family protein [Nitrososphaeraceae archaeon]
MSSDSKDRVDKSADIKNAAALLLKGGSLISEPCSKCGGVQVKFKENISCVNCGKRQNIPKMNHHTTASGEEYIPLDKDGTSQLHLEPVEFIIREKILILSRDIKDEKDLVIQKQKADLIDVYVRIVERIRVLRE